MNTRMCEGCNKPIFGEYAKIDGHWFHFVDHGPSCYHASIFPMWPSRAAERTWNKITIGRMPEKVQ